MNERLMLSVALMAVFIYGSYLAASYIWGQPGPFLFGCCCGLVLGLALYYVARLRWRQRESALRNYVSYVANTVSLVYLRHGPCPVCGHAPQDGYADGFGVHAATCPILAEITEFGKIRGE